MANMSYCMFENTASDFRQCLEKIGGIESLDELSSTERKAAERMRDMAEQYVEWFEQL